MARRGLEEEVDMTYREIDLIVRQFEKEEWIGADLIRSDRLDW